MKLNINTTETGQINRFNSKSLLKVATRDGLNDFAMQILEVKAVLFAASLTDDMPEQGLNLLLGGERLVNILEKDFDALHRAVIDATTYTTSLTNTDAQALLALLLGMLKDWRILISKEGNRMDSKAVEASLEQAVSIASTLALNSVTGIKGGAV